MAEADSLMGAMQEQLGRGVSRNSLGAEAAQSDNCIGDDGARALAAALEKNTTLTMLDLEGARLCVIGGWGGWDGAGGMAHARGWRRAHGCGGRAQRVHGAGRDCACTGRLACGVLGAHRRMRCFSLSA